MALLVPPIFDAFVPNRASRACVLFVLLVDSRLLLALACAVVLRIGLRHCEVGCLARAHARCRIVVREIVARASNLHIHTLLPSESRCTT